MLGVLVFIVGVLMMIDWPEKSRIFEGPLVCIYGIIDLFYTFGILQSNMASRVSLQSSCIFFIIVVLYLLTYLVSSSDNLLMGFIFFGVFIVLITISTISQIIAVLQSIMFKK